jgi:hypothetical protein
MDVICAQCGEPFDYYGIYHGDFEKEDIEPFLRGEHCPCCKGYPERRTGEYWDEHFSSLLEATDDPDAVLDYFPL